MVNSPGARTSCSGAVADRSRGVADGPGVAAGADCSWGEVSALSWAVGSSGAGTGGGTECVVDRFDISGAGGWEGTYSARAENGGTCHKEI